MEDGGYLTVGRQVHLRPTYLYSKEQASLLHITVFKVDLADIILLERLIFEPLSGGCSFFILSATV